MFWVQQKPLVSTLRDIDATFFILRSGLHGMIELEWTRKHGACVGFVRPRRPRVNTEDNQLRTKSLLEGVSFRWMRASGAPTAKTKKSGWRIVPALYT